MFDLTSYLAQSREQVNSALRSYIDFPTTTEAEKKIREAMAYSIFAGGKRLRPILCMAAAEAVGSESGRVLPGACAIEMLHTYSLIHDDLPCMDNDDYRRGKLTNHKVFGEGLAVLAGDALLTLSFEIIGRELKEHEPLVVLRVVQELAQAAGCKGMVAGQVMDLISEHKQLTTDELRQLDQQKTGALIEASLKIGGLLAGGQPQAICNLSSYGRAFGWGFQIIDDILDITGDAQQMGKQTGQDEKRQKATYPAMLGLTKSRELADLAAAQAREALAELPGNTQPLLALTGYLTQRES